MKSILVLVFSLSLFASSNGVVYDKKLHLMWEDGKNVSTKFSNWEEAKRYCEGLKLSGFDDWRLPNIEELSSVLDMSRYMPSIKSEFKSVAKDEYWTSTPDAGDFKFVWAVDFGSGIDNRNAKTNLHLTRCVREQKIVSTLFGANCTKDDKKSVVKCKDKYVGKLMWQDDKSVSSDKMSWKKAKSHCQKLKLAGFSDWRVPNVYELRSIVDFTKRRPALNSAFKNVDDFPTKAYWSSTTDASKKTNAWAIHFAFGDKRFYDKSNTYLVRCVR